MPILRAPGFRRFDSDEHITLVEREESQELLCEISNLDVFFGQVYNYYYARGMVCVLTEGVLRIIRTIFVIAFTTYLALFVDWHAVMTCHNEACETVNLVRSQPLKDLGNARLLWLGCPFPEKMHFNSFPIQPQTRGQNVAYLTCVFVRMAPGACVFAMKMARRD